MKNIMLIICFISISNLIAQEKIILTFRDGSIKKGLGRITMNDKIFLKAMKMMKKYYMITNQ